MPPSEDEASLKDDEFVVPEDPVEQQRFKRRLIATANSLKKKQQQLQADQDLLADRWTEVLAAEEYKLERPSKKLPKTQVAPPTRGGSIHTFITSARYGRPTTTWSRQRGILALNQDRTPASLQKYEAKRERAGLARCTGGQSKAIQIHLWITWAPYDPRRIPSRRT